MVKNEFAFERIGSVITLHRLTISLQIERRGVDVTGVWERSQIAEGFQE